MIKSNTKTRIKTSLILLIFLYLMLKYNIFSTYIIIVFGIISILEFLTISKKILQKKLYNYLINFFFIIYIFLFSCFFFITLNFYHLKIIFFIFLFGCVASDIGGFVIGKMLKGPRLTKISPNKTYSGSIGAIFFTCTTISFAIFLFTNSFSYLIFLVAILTSVGCQIGDLIFSYLKRKAKFKDTGKILPGHGGVLDRVDGILLGIPTGFISLILLS